MKNISKNIPTIAVGVNEEKFADAMISEFGGDIVTKTVLMMGEEAGEVMSVFDGGLSRGLRNAVRKWVRTNSPTDACERAQLRGESGLNQVKIIVNGVVAPTKKEIEAAANVEGEAWVDIHADLHRVILASKERTEEARETALKSIERKTIALAMFKYIASAMYIVAKALVKEYGRFSHEDYQVNIKKAIRVVSEGGARTLSIEGRPVFKGKYGIIKMAEQILIDEIRDAKRLVFAKIHKGKVVTASVIDDLKHIKGQLHFATKERSGSMIRSLEKIAKRVGRRVRRTANTIVTAIKARGHLWQRA